MQAAPSASAPTLVQPPAALRLGRREGRRDCRGLLGEWPWGWLLPPRAPVHGDALPALGSGKEGQSWAPACRQGWGGQRLWEGWRELLSQRALSPQRLKDEIAEVTNEIENLGSTEER